MPQHTLLKRKDVQTSDTWKLEDIFENDTLVEESIKRVKEDLKAMLPYKGQVASSAATLFEVLEKSDKLSSLASKIYTYSHMRLHQDSNNSFYQDLASRSEALLIEFGSAVSFIEPELSELTEEEAEALLTENDGLKLYTRYLSEILRQKEHILDSETENLLSQFAEVANAPSNIYAMLNNADIKFPTIKDSEGHDVQITHGRFIQLLESKDVRVRKEAFKAVYNTYGSFKNTIATIFSSNVKQYGLFSRTKRFESPMHRALSANNIPIDVYNNLISTVNSNLNLMHDYVALRKEMLGVSELHMYDLFVPMVNQFEKKISYEEACEIILEALTPLGEDYVAIVREGFENRWVDRYENEGKRSGAYSWGTYDAPHPFVLMNYVDNVNNMFTLAHEMGHALHSYLTSHTQPYPYADYCIFVAEVASTVNEALLMQHLLKTTKDENYRKYLVNYFMEQFRTTLYRQTMFADFEKEVHNIAAKGMTLTADVLSETYYKLVKAYHGDAMCVDPEIALEWARIPHFYTPFYVYQYATGYSAAIALSNRILTEGDTAVADYKTFLSGGSSKDPIDLLKIAGVDMSSSQPIEEALKVFEGLISEMKELI
ncbi:MAG: oligoendopeptidase F [Cellulosilyticaceae bacterium]